MATLHPVIYKHHRRADGSYNIKIRLTHKGVSRWLPTNYYALPHQLTRSLKIKDATLLQGVNNLIHQMQDALSAIPAYDMSIMSVDEVKRAMQDNLRGWRLCFEDYADAYIARMPNKGTAGNYVTALNAWRRFRGGPTDINEITSRMVMEFVAWLDSTAKYYSTTGAARDTGKPRKQGVTARKYTALLSTIFKAARREFNDDLIVKIPRMPFEGLQIKAEPAHGQRNLGTELIQKIISADRADIPDAQAFALDVFVVSFGLMGINLIDLIALRPPVDGVITYNRSKVSGRRADQAMMRVRVPECLGPFIERIQKRGRGSAWLPLYRHTENAQVAGCNIRHALERWCKAEGIEVFTLYACRHSWASIARSAAVGIEKELVEECLAHNGAFPLADIYAERDFDRINEANAKVLALFSWPARAGSSPVGGESR